MNRLLFAERESTIWVQYFQHKVMLERQHIYYHPGLPGHSSVHGGLGAMSQMAERNPSNDIVRAGLIANLKDLGTSAKYDGLQGEDLYEHQKNAVAPFNRVCVGKFAGYRINVDDIMP